MVFTLKRTIKVQIITTKCYFVYTYQRKKSEIVLLLNTYPLIWVFVEIKSSLTNKYLINYKNLQSLVSCVFNWPHSILLSDPLKLEGPDTKREEETDTSTEGEERNKLAYCVTDVPPWYLCIILGIQVRQQRAFRGIFEAIISSLGDHVS